MAGKKKKVEYWEVTGYDSFSREGYHIGHFTSEKAAMDKARESGGTMNLTYVMNPKGECIAKFGSY